MYIHRNMVILKKIFSILLLIFTQVTHNVSQTVTQSKIKFWT